MSASRPRCFATWLVNRLVSGNKRDSLVGDLVEQHQLGRSSAWYWRQAIIAIIVGAVTDVRGHKWLAVRAAAVGFTVYLLSAFPILWLLQWLSGVRNAPLVWAQNWLLETGHDSLRLWLFQLIPFWLPEGLAYVAAALSGWVVARLNSRHAAGMVGVYGASALLFEFLQVFVLRVLDGGRHPTDPNTVFVVIALLIARRREVGIPLSILAGGLCGARPDGEAPRNIAIR